MGHIVLKRDFLLTARAVEVAKSNLGRCPSVCQHHLEAVGMENVPTSSANTRLFAEFAREANATELALSTTHQNIAFFVSIDGNLDACFVEAGKAS